MSCSVRCMWPSREGQVSGEHELDGGDRTTPPHRRYQARPRDATGGGRPRPARAPSGRPGRSSTSGSENVRATTAYPRSEPEARARPGGPRRCRHRPARGPAGGTASGSRTARVSRESPESRRARTRPPPGRFPTVSVRSGARRRTSWRPARSPCKPHQKPVGRRHAKQSVRDLVRRVKGRDVALRDERHAQAHSVAPERQPAFRQRARQFGLQRPVHPIGVAPHGLVADQEASQQRAHSQRDQEPRQLAAREIGTGPIRQALP